MILAIGIGLIISMKKVNDGIENVTNTKGFVLHLLQSLASDLIYTPFIIALIVIMILEPIIQKAAFKKYIPNYGQNVAGDEDIKYVLQHIKRGNTHVRIKTEFIGM